MRLLGAPANERQAIDGAEERWRRVAPEMSAGGEFAARTEGATRKGARATRERERSMGPSDAWSELPRRQSEHSSSRPSCALSSCDRARDQCPTAILAIDGAEERRRRVAPETSEKFRRQGSWEPARRGYREPDRWGRGAYATSCPGDRRFEETKDSKNGRNRQNGTEPRRPSGGAKIKRPRRQFLAVPAKNGAPAPLWPFWPKNAKTAKNASSVKRDPTPNPSDHRKVTM